MRLKPLLLTATLCAGIAITRADEFKPPPTKEGFWETHSSQVQQGKTVSSSSVKMCKSNEQTKALQKTAEEVRKRNECTSTVSQPDSSTYVEESRCAKGPNAGSVTHVTYTYQGDTATHTEMRMSIRGTESVMTIDAKYVGNCPSGMKPGDFMMGDGKIISGGIK